MVQPRTTVTVELLAEDESGVPTIEFVGNVPDTATDNKLEGSKYTWTPADTQPVQLRYE